MMKHMMKYIKTYDFTAVWKEDMYFAHHIRTIFVSFTGLTTFYTLEQWGLTKNCYEDFITHTLQLYNRAQDSR